MNEFMRFTAEAERRKAIQHNKKKKNVCMIREGKKWKQKLKNKKVVKWVKGKEKENLA